MIIKLIYKYGKLDYIDFLDNNLSNDLKEAFTRYARYSLPWYKDLDYTELTCVVAYDYSKGRSKSDDRLKALLESKIKSIPPEVQLLPVDSNSNTEFPYLLYNTNLMSSSKNRVLGLKNLYGNIIMVRDLIKEEFALVKVTSVDFKKTVYNDYIPSVNVEGDRLEISNEDFLRLKITAGDTLKINTTTGEIYPTINKDSFVVGLCECGKELAVINNRIVCGNKYDLCCFDYNTIVNNFLLIADDDELNNVYLSYTSEDLPDFVEYLQSITNIKFNDLSKEHKCTFLFNSRDNIDIPSDYTIDDCIKSFKYSQGVPMKYKKQYISIIKGLYKDE